jgi:uncharacterized protein
VRPLLLAALLALIACSPPAERSKAEAPAPPLASVGPALDRPAYVVDSADMLVDADENRIAERLRAFERRTQHQMIVVTVPSTNDSDIADFTRALANRWGVGRRGHNDGVVMLLARDDRRLRIAVGDGLTRQFSNDVAAEIIRTEMVPRLKSGDATGAVRAGLDAILARLDP